MPRHKKIFIIAFVILALTVAGSLVGYKLFQPKIPKNIKRQVSFVILLPSGMWKVDSNKITYDSTNRVLTILTTNGSDTIALKEQATPDQFVDTPQFYPALINKLNEYKTLQTSAGDVSLTNPKELNGGQTAVLNNKGTLLFAKPNKNLTDDEWRNLFNNIQLIL